MPPHPPLNLAKCAIAYDTGYPKTTGDAKAWTVTANGKYNYDDTYQFKKLEVYLVYNNPTKGTTVTGPQYTVTNETTLATPGSYATTFSNVAPPAQGEVIQAIARIRVTKNNQDETNTATADVAAPPP